MSRPLIATFLAQIQGPAGGDGLSVRLAALLAGARERWPELGVSESAFGACLGARVAAEADPVAALAGLRGEDLSLVCGRLEGDARALRALEAGPLHRVRDKLQRSGLRPEVVADADPELAHLKGTYRDPSSTLMSNSSVLEIAAIMLQFAFSPPRSW